MGLTLDLSYIRTHYGLILLITLSILVINSLLSAIVFRVLRHNWSESLYGGALLSQTGELGLLAGAVAFKAHLIDEGFFKTELAVTSVTLLLSTVWMSMLRRLTGHHPRTPTQRQTHNHEQHILYYP
jgi:CPA2 family monovalent cation:H+ antiporter-2